MPHILYISYDGMTDPLGQSQVLPYLVGLSAKGYSITLISCEKSERWQYKETVQAICTQHHINWQPLMYTRKPIILSTLKDIKKIQQSAIALHQKMAFDLVHCRSYIAALVGQKMKQKFDIPFLFDMRGFWADERVDGGLWNLKKPIYKRVYQYFKKKESQFLVQADAVVSLTHAAQEEIEKWGLAHAPITVIPCCVDTQLFDPESLKTLPSPGLVSLSRRLPPGRMATGFMTVLWTTLFVS